MHFRVIDIKSANPFERGQQYGRGAADLIHQALRGYRHHFKNHANIDWELIKEKANAYEELVTEYFPELILEAKGIADGAECTVGDIMALNCRYEILKFPVNECTSFAVLKEANEQGVTLIGQNWDYRTWVMEHSVILRINEENGTKVIGLTEAGQLLRNGVNSHGVALCANNLLSTSDTPGQSVPSTFLRRQVLQQDSIAKAKDLIVNAPRKVSCNYMIGSDEDLAYDIEATPKEAYVLTPEEGILTHANHLVVEPEMDRSDDLRFRDLRLREVLLQKRPLNIDKIRAAVGDHQKYPDAVADTPEFEKFKDNAVEAVCTHPDPAQKDPDLSWQTIATVIYDTTHREAYIGRGTPCTAEFKHFKVADL